MRASFILILARALTPPRCPRLLSAVCARELMIGKRFDSPLQPPRPSTVLVPDRNRASLMWF